MNNPIEASLNLLALADDALLALRETTQPPLQDMLRHVSTTVRANTGVFLEDRRKSLLALRNLRDGLVTAQQSNDREALAYLPILIGQANGALFDLGGQEWQNGVPGKLPPGHPDA